MKNKKSQITIFIIVGIILLFAIAGFIFIKEKITRTNISAPEEIISATLPQEVQPIKQYVEECLYQTTKDAFLIMGQNGGYLSLENKNINPVDPTESEGFEPLPNQKVPYWMWMSSENSCDYNCWIEAEYPMLEYPYKESIEYYAMQYVVDNIDSCLNDFKEFKKQGYNISLTDSYYSIIKVGDKDISVELNYPIEISFRDKKFKLKKYNTKLNLKFKEIYDYATTILYQELIYHNLQSNVYSAINAYQRVDANAMPPMDRTVFSRFPIKWYYSSLKNRLQILLLDYTNSLGIYNSDYTLPFYLFEEQPFWTEYYYSKFLINFENAPEYFNDYKVNIRYQGWPYYFDITPRSGEEIKPSRILELPMPSMFDSLIPPSWVYKFNYDISYPVLIEIEDPTAFNGEGYMFRYGMEFNIRNNQVVEWMDNETVNNTSPFQQAVSPSTETLFCDTKNSGNITLTIKDKFNNNPINNAIVYFESGKDSCALGETDENGVFVSKFPTGYGILKIVKEDYANHKEYYLTSVDNQDEKTIYLYPLTNITVEVKFPKVAKRWKKGDDILTEKEIEEDAWENVIEECIVLSSTNPIPAIGPFISILGGLNAVTNQGIDWEEIEKKSSSDVVSILYKDVEHYKKKRETWVVLNNESLSLEEDEQLIIQFIYHDKNGFDDVFTPMPITIKGEEVNAGEKIKKTIQLIPGKYTIIANIMKQMNPPLQIPEERSCKDMFCGQDSLFGYDDINCYDLPEQNLTSLVVGMYSTETPELNEADIQSYQEEIWNYYDELPQDKIKNQKTLKIYVPKITIDKINSTKDLSVIGMFQNFTKNYPKETGVHWS